MNTLHTPRNRRLRRSHLAIAGLAAFSLAAAACGSDEEAAPATNPPTTEEASSDVSSTDESMDESMSEMAGSQFGPACSAVPTDGEGSFGGMADDPAATAASNNPVLSTLVTAVVEAGLVDTLNSEGPFTIFAPTNDAFAAIPAADLAAVLADKDLLTSVLTYHVVAGESMSSQELITAGTVTTVNGADLTITDVDGTLTVNGIPTVCMDVPTANATVHIIGGVLLPA